MKHLFTVLLTIVILAVVFTMSSIAAEEKVGNYTIHSVDGSDVTELKKWVDLLELVDKGIPVSFQIERR